MPKSSVPLLLLSIFISISLLNVTVVGKGNGYLKLVRYNYTYALQMADKNLEKYFTENLKKQESIKPTMPISTPFENMVTNVNNFPVKQPTNAFQKITTEPFHFPSNANGAQHFQIIHNGHQPFEINDDMLQKIFAEKFNQQKPTKYKFEDKKPFVMPKPQKEIKQHVPQMHREPTQKVNTGPSGKDWEDQVNRFALQYLNEFRNQNNLSSLAWDPKVFEVTRPHTQSMGRIGKISHDGFDHRADMLEKSFFVYQSAENVAYFSTWDNVDASRVARKLTDQWINSPGHRRNMLLPNLTHVGISILKIKKENDYFYGTQFFIRK